MNVAVESLTVPPLAAYSYAPYKKKTLNDGNPQQCQTLELNLLNISGLLHSTKY